MKFEPVIGLEIHIQLNTKRKMFCYCPNDIWKKAPNSVVCPTCLGLPGALPVPNKEAIKKVQIFGFALGCKLSKKTNFDRKNYFYPDLPKGYQISQYDKPFCFDGVVKLPDGDVRIKRIHLEEDTGKSIHDKKTDSTLLDFNKSGIPLMELVTEPDIKSPKQAFEFAKKIAEMAEYVGVSNVNMEQGNLRLEPSISLRKVGDTNLPNYRVELKNINSFKFMKNALEYEIIRQTEELENENKIPQQTRGWNEKLGKSFLQREKEEEHEYRYFPEPDIPPFEFDEKYIKAIKSQVPKSFEDSIEELSQKSKVAGQKIEELLRLNRWELVESLVIKGLNYSTAANLVLSANSDVLKSIKEDPEGFVNKHNGAKEFMVSSSEELNPIIKKVISDNLKSVEDYKKGNENALNFLLGQVMKETNGKANAKIVRNMILKILRDK
ncbi:Asp-tRNA(Asn)/Glu-tRNA(Gln) amidotransferase GatCAB subunit B [candidate division WWE3 bacterium CG10_big_fil_rev_8_21_14_0_10_32_10]|uniref:Aspartyl/glutamyl-tRNA(Asn/Gln) amidotransferase subunit B n=1 Tax=candidate division WWE3 bacterium CG10_big_fil_rev_8_21_14_0_10_32_10 TaxID=1975090 RepID=A0A2H0R9Z0_UNCKA|nr:MAG: Asp-tRNA(Asn)/Glu-tRNA(Gln) amidotransferase GatCAB subunit B [candidate division WWE3 bacterium CG10_big_fil_rev_8_21_14_0_10_32_10]